jgi:hypothetical protein
MSGIDFMALANGMMLGDKLNKEDDTYWRKQAKEDQQAQYDARDQAFKEQQQGYTLSDWQDQRTVRDGQRMAATAYDTYAKAAAAQGIPIHEVIMNSPAFNLEGASPDLQAQFSKHLNNSIAMNVTGNLRKQGKYAEADALEARLGQAVQGGENPLSYIGDPVKTDAYFGRKFPGVVKNADGTYDVPGIGQKRTAAELFALSTRTAAAGAADLANYGMAANIKADNATTQAQIDKNRALTADITARNYLGTMIANGSLETDVPESLRGTFREMKAARDAAGATTNGAKPANTIDALTTQPAVPVTPGWVTEQRNAAPAAAMPARVSSEPAAAMPDNYAPSAGSVIAPGVSGNPLTDYKTSLVKLEKLRSAQEDAQRDIRLLEKAKANGHFDPETLARARAKLEEQTLAYNQQGLVHSVAAENWRKRVQAEENRYNAANAPQVSAPGRPGYLDALAHKYR